MKKLKNKTIFVLLGEKLFDVCARTCVCVCVYGMRSTIGTWNTKHSVFEWKYSMTRGTLSKWLLCIFPGSAVIPSFVFMFHCVLYSKHLCQKKGEKFCEFWLSSYFSPRYVFRFCEMSNRTFLDVLPNVKTFFVEILTGSDHGMNHSQNCSR